MITSKTEEQLKRKWCFMKTYRGLEHLHKVQWKWKNWQRVFLNSSPPIPYVYFPGRSGISATPIRKVIRMGGKEDADCKTFIKKRCMHCKKPEIICIVDENCPSSIMRYKQLKKCMRRKLRKKEQE